MHHLGIGIKTTTGYVSDIVMEYKAELQFLERKRSFTEILHLVKSRSFNLLFLCTILSHCIYMKCLGVKYKAGLQFWKGNNVYTFTEII